MFYVIIATVKNNGKVLGIILFAFSLMGYYFTSFVNFRLYWGLDIALTALVFYGLGYLFNNIKYQQLKSFILNPSITKVIVFLVISIFLSFRNDYVNMRTLQYGNYFLYYLSSVTSIAMYIMLAIYVEKIVRFNKSKVYKYLLYVGKNTIIVLVLNNLFIICLKAIDKEGANILHALIVIILMIPTAYLINRYLPFAVGRKYEKIQLKQQ